MDTTQTQIKVNLNNAFDDWDSDIVEQVKPQKKAFEDLSDEEKEQAKPSSACKMLMPECTSCE